MPLLLCLGFGLSLFGQSGIQFETGEWETILQKAESEGKPIFVDVYTDWCGPCIKMSREVFPQKEVGDYYNANFINVKIDAEKGEGPTLTQKFGAIGYPTLLFVSADEEVLQKVVGGLNTEMFMALGRDALRPEMRLPNLRKQFDEGNRGLAFLKSYLALANMAHEPGRQAVAEAYLAVEQDWASEFNLKLIFKGMEHADSPLFDFVAERLHTYEQWFRPNVLKHQLMERVRKAFDPSLMIYKEEEQAMAKAKALIQKAYPQETNKLLANFKTEYYLMTKQYDRCKDAMEDYLDRYGSSAYNLVRFAGALEEAEVDDPRLLKRAVIWTKEALVSENDDFYNHYLLAALYDKLGKTEKAKRRLEYAYKKGDGWHYPYAEELRQHLGVSEEHIPYFNHAKSAQR